MPLFDPELAGLPLKIDTTGVRIGLAKEIVEHSPPGKNGARLEDTGERARVFNFRAWFIGDAADQLPFLLEEFEDLDNQEFIHPELGSIVGKIKTLDPVHDDKTNTVAYQVSFIENVFAESFRRVFPNIVEQANSTWLENLPLLIDNFKQKVRDALLGDADGILSTVLDPDTPILEQFSTITGAAFEYVKAIDTVLRVVEADLSDITNPANSLIAISDFATDLPGRTIGAFSRSAERYLILHDTLSTFPDRFSENVRNSLDQLAQTLGLDRIPAGQSPLEIANNASLANQKAAFKISTSLILGAKMADIYSNDEIVRNKVRDLIGIKTFDENGNFLGAVEVGDIIPIDDMENSLATIREMLQEALELDRSLTGTFKLARDLLSHITDIKLTKESLITVKVETPAPLVNIMHANGLDYHLLDEVLKLNPFLEDKVNFAYGDIRLFDQGRLQLAA